MAETLPLVVSNYCFFGSEGEPVSFAYLPLQWGDAIAEISSNDNKTEIYLTGSTDDGHRNLHQQVKAWKFKFLKEKPEISVLSKNNKWIILQNPLESYEIKVRTILITLQCLQFFKRQPEASREALRDHLFQVFSSYEDWPSEYDFINHLDFIRQVVTKDKTLGKSKYLASLLDGKYSRKRRDLQQHKDDDSESYDEDICPVCKKLHPDERNIKFPEIERIKKEVAVTEDTSDESENVITPSEPLKKKR